MKIVAEKTKYHRFAFYYDYDPMVVEFCRSLKDAFGWQEFSFETSGTDKRWVFSNAVIVASIQKTFGDTTVDPDVRKIIQHEIGIELADKTQREVIEDIKKKTDTDIKITGIKGELYPYQKIGLEFLTVAKGRAIIADAPGVGKTAQSLAYSVNSNFKRTLVVCPASVKFAWASEIKKWTSKSSVIIDGKTKLHEIDASINYWIINFDQLKKHLPQLQKIQFDLIIGDEAHMIKSVTAIRTKAFRLLSRNIPNVVLLTGTPLLSRPVELFSLLNIIDPKTWENYYDFARRYCGAKQTRFGLDVSGSSNIPELHSRINKYFLRRVKEDVLKELPEKIHIEVPVELPSDIMKQYNTAEESFVSYMKQYSGKQPAEIAKTLEAEKLAKINILRSLVARGEINTAVDLIDSIIESGEKVIVFSSFIEPLEILQEKYGSQAVMITGKINPNLRGDIVKKFQEDDSVKVFLGGFKSAGSGITLTAASNTLLIGYPWNPADREQAENRNHRPGIKASSVNIYQLHCPGTIDDDQKDMLDKKQKVFNAVIDGDEDSTKRKSVDMIAARLMSKYK